jgi:tRNA 2-selenouridine synthase SelU
MSTTMIRQDTLDYQKIFLEDIPLLDVRAPVEFDRGAFPHSQNIPILDDPQREAIGTCYKIASIRHRSAEPQLSGTRKKPFKSTGLITH